ncbi:MAG: Y-family DNA polymerase [Spirochaetes bacterium]|jgi:DNA polymerase V|nr:Y-family DNA polymerase [Spirochaetota bacterium]
MYFLADCNNFYVSCERVFNPRLRGRPVIILSNNDGCAVALSNEAKALGIPRGAPLFKWRSFLDRHNGIYLSSNYTLYGDMSRRVMDLLATFSEECEVYSIDEAFLATESLSEKSALSLAEEIRETILRCTGIPMSIGAGTTKTLAKAANAYAKKNVKNGCCCITDFNRKKILQMVPVSQVWGIGVQHARLLAHHGINTTAEFIDMPESWVRKRMAVTGLRTLLELNGTPCIKMEKYPPNRRSIVSSRSFGTPVSKLALLSESVHEYGCRAATRLRSMNLLCSSLTVYIATNLFKDEPHYSNSATVTLNYPTDSSPIITKEATRLLHTLFKEGYQYKKTGIMLHGLTPKDEQQYSLFSQNDHIERDSRLMSVMDSLNIRYGSKTVVLASEGLTQSWQMKRQFLSPAYTTRWSDLPCVKTE